MSILNRKFIRFSLDIPAIRDIESGGSKEIIIEQISIGGCLTQFDENIVPGEEFRIELRLPNKNKLPLQCKAIYKFEGKGIGIRFTEITRFEQDLLAEIISEKLEEEGLPLLIDPFLQPPGYADTQLSENADDKLKEDLKIEQVIAAFDQFQ